jgi:methylmalonyl-CoA/ethylmalonyl-CoA epimerase
MIVDHIGIVVRDLDHALALWEKLFSLKPTVIRDMPEAGLRIAYLKTQNVEIELLQYSMEEESFGKKVMGSRPGLNHLSVRVDHVDDSIQDLERKGVIAKEGFPRQGSHGRIAFFEPETTGGILMEICENEEKDGGLE